MPLNQPLNSSSSPLHLFLVTDPSLDSSVQPGSLLLHLSSLPALSASPSLFLLLFILCATLSFTLSLFVFFVAVAMIFATLWVSEKLSSNNHNIIINISIVMKASVLLCFFLNIGRWHKKKKRRRHCPQWLMKINVRHAAAPLLPPPPPHSPCLWTAFSYPTWLTFN